uniref:C6 transcription factor n=1 Tax=Paecilomyces fulvus TaxID=89137 RepID=A0A172WCU2_9EURO|nr:C6 transcription factor [Paecilomyces fulvus]
MSAETARYRGKIEKHEGLGKSLKVRSTCNACQQAKIRCSHDKPSCRRCLKQNITCVYSISRRLGRPSRKVPKKANEEDTSHIPNQHQDELDAQSPRLLRPDHKNSPLNIAIADRTEITQPNADFEASSVIDFAEDIQLYPGDDSLDFTTESWMQGLDCDMEIDANDCLTNCELRVSERENIGSAASLYEIHGEDIIRSTDKLNHAYGAAGDGLSFEQNSAMQNTKKPTYRIDPDMNLDTRFLAMGDSSPLDISRVSDTIHNFTSDDSGLGSASSASGDCCSCYESVLRELLYIDSTCARNLPLPIDKTLKSQQGLQILVDKVLKCRTCSQRPSNLLILLIVSIDSLISMFETTLSSKSQASHDYAAADLHSSSKSWNAGALGFKSFLAQIEACPLLVGNYRVRVEEKTSFLKQLLHSRLCTLSSTIRRVRMQVQQHHHASSSKARLIMITESDRRLQMTIMKVKLWSS